MILVYGVNYLVTYLFPSGSEVFFVTILGPADNLQGIFSDYISRKGKPVSQFHLVSRLKVQGVLPQSLNPLNRVAHKRKDNYCICWCSTSRIFHGFICNYCACLLIHVSKTGEAFTAIRPNGRSVLSAGFEGLSVKIHLQFELFYWSLDAHPEGWVDLKALKPAATVIGVRTSWAVPWSVPLKTYYCKRFSRHYAVSVCKHWVSGGKIRPHVSKTLKVTNTLLLELEIPNPLKYLRLTHFWGRSINSTFSNI
jgi:hypothetical protein